MWQRGFFFSQERFFLKLYCILWTVEYCQHQHKGKADHITKRNLRHCSRYGGCSYNISMCQFTWHILQLSYLKFRTRAKMSSAFIYLCQQSFEKFGSSVTKFLGGDKISRRSCNFVIHRKKGLDERNFIIQTLNLDNFLAEKTSYGLQKVLRKKSIFPLEG